MADPIIIIGAGQAGASLAARLRALGYDGPLLMLGEEPVSPYQRPPLSKKYMSGELDLSRLLIRPESWYAEQNIELRLSTPVAALSPGERRVILADGVAAPLRQAGADDRRAAPPPAGFCRGRSRRRLHHPQSGRCQFPRARPAAGQDHAGGGGRLYRPRSRRGRRGQGAAGRPRRDGAAHPAARGLLLSRRITSAISTAATACVIRESAGLLELLGTEGRLTGALMADGSVIEADLAVIGIGITPNDELAQRGRARGGERHHGRWILPQRRGGDLRRRRLRQFPLARPSHPARIRAERRRAGRACRSSHAGRGGITIPCPGSGRINMTSSCRSRVSTAAMTTRCCARASARAASPSGISGATVSRRGCQERRAGLCLRQEDHRGGTDDPQEPSPPIRRRI